jgi:hypothetical protein
MQSRPYIGVSRFRGACLAVRTHRVVVALRFAGLELVAGPALARLADDHLPILN